MILGSILRFWNRPKRGNKTTDAPKRINFQGRYVIVMTRRLRGPAASCQALWWSLRTILFPGPRRFIIRRGPRSYFCTYTLGHSLPFDRGAI